MGLEIGSSSIVCVEAEVKGDVQIGKLCVVHPYARILATGGPIIIGDGNIVEEFSTIENTSNKTMSIGNQNVFEVRSSVKAKKIGDQNVFEISSVVGEGVEIGNGTSFGAATTVIASENNNIKIPDNSVFFGNPLQHRIANDRTQNQNPQIDFLSRILPNYHNIVNPRKPGL